MHLLQVKLYWVLIPCQFRWRNDTWRLLYQDLLSLVSCTTVRNSGQVPAAQGTVNFESKGRAQAGSEKRPKQPSGRAFRSRYISKSWPREPTYEMVNTLL